MARAYRMGGLVASLAGGVGRCSLDTDRRGGRLAMAADVVDHRWMRCSPPWLLTLAVVMAGWGEDASGAATTTSPGGGGGGGRGPGGVARFVLAAVLGTLLLGASCGETNVEAIRRLQPRGSLVRAKLARIAGKLPPPGRVTRAVATTPRLAPPLELDFLHRRHSADVLMAEQLVDPDVDLTQSLDLMLSPDLLRCLMWTGPENPLDRSVWDDRGNIGAECEHAFDVPWLVVVRTVRHELPARIDLEVFVVDLPHEQLVVAFPITLVGRDRHGDIGRGRWAETALAELRSDAYVVARCTVARELDALPGAQVDLRERWGEELTRDPCGQLPRSMAQAPRRPYVARSAPSRGGRADAGAVSTTRPLAARCRDALQTAPAPPSAARCDSTFRPSAGHVDCYPDDLLCQIRAPSQQSFALYHPPAAVERVECSRECEAGNGASCYRLAQWFLRSRGPLGADEAKACLRDYAAQACRLGLPQGCGRGQGPPGEAPEIAPAAAFARLEGRCDPAVASWACFYLAHSTAMAWGTGLGSQERVKALYHRVCQARCPEPPARCYRELACQRHEQLSRQ